MASAKAAWPGMMKETPLDPTMKPWLDLWDYLDSKLWGFWQWAAAHLSPAEVGWQRRNERACSRMSSPWLNRRSSSPVSGDT
jgi:hypothetical protein